MAATFQVTIDCADPQRLVRFWAAALGYLPEPPPDGFARWDEYWRSRGLPDSEVGDGGTDSLVDPAGIGPRIWFQVVPEAKVVKNRLHLDVDVSDRRGESLERRRQKVRAEADRLVELGGSIVAELALEGADHFAVTMRDPEGNEFCLR